MDIAIISICIQMVGKFLLLPLQGCKSEKKFSPLLAFNKLQTESLRLISGGYQTRNISTEQLTRWVAGVKGNNAINRLQILASRFIHNVWHLICTALLKNNSVR